MESVLTLRKWNWIYVCMLIKIFHDLNFMIYAHNEKEVISKQDDEFLDQFQPNFMSFNHYMGTYIVEYVNILLIWSLMIWIYYMLILQAHVMCACKFDRSRLLNTSYFKWKLNLVLNFITPFIMYCRNMWMNLKSIQWIKNI
jgi:hypothetical protein